MYEAELKQILNQVQEGKLNPDEALAMVRHLPYKDLGFAKLDYHRELRQGFGEVIYAPGKTPEQCADLVRDLLEHTTAPVLLSRPDEAQVKQVLKIQQKSEPMVFDQLMVWRPAAPRSEQIAIISAGTADQPVVEECASTLEAHGITPTCIKDVGVAGLHRLLDQVDSLMAAELVIVVAGMEGALASVVGGITPAPVIAVPTSAGYGTSFEGITALMSMLASCATGITVIGIDNGLGAAFATLRYLKD